MRWTTFLAAALLATPALAQSDDAVAPRDHYAASQMASMRAMNICSGLWHGGLDLATIERELNGRDASFGVLADQGGTGIDHQARMVSTRYTDGMPPRVVVWRPVLGCIQLPPGAGPDAAEYLPRLPGDFAAPNLDDRAWPTGDRDALRPLTGDRAARLDSLVAQAFDGQTFGGRTWGVVIVHRGYIVAERYAEGFNRHTASQTHSAAKSFAATLVGIAQGQGIVAVEDDHLLGQWRSPGDPRAGISLGNLLHMASGLNTRGMAPPRFMDAYTQGTAVPEAVAGNFLAARPGSEFVYSPADTMLVMRALREALNDDARYLRFPYEELFWRIGMTRTSMNVDGQGNVFGSGQSWSTARDFARFGLLYLHDGVWNGERVLPAGWVDYATTPAPAQPAEGPGYGAQFWLYGPQHGLPEGSFTPSGGQGQYAMAIPSADLVVVRRGTDLGPGFDIARFSAQVLAALQD
ncbi:serine hydrolase domain-containing protein [Alteraurantiacibacter buctensis]|uniref:Serine hydrolase n=1 Tax=Alteraurantiacibacter buctensis TaxID=1503981 RepID=A0A844YZ31_9SPHN|nr:serine hydrolase [Alteraurantiacibacter buctensis]MXO70983.1 serine hydrolase [Alteraurantiacibacter buctensis]